MFCKSITIIDDDPISIILSKKLLEKYNVLTDGIQFNSFTSPIAGLDFIKAHKNEETLNILLLDINMPEMSGFEVLNELSKLNLKNFNVFMLTSSISDSHRDTAYEYELVKKFFRKPLLEEAILEINRYLGFKE
ncbi:response regulator [Algoriphagus sp. AK58]|uniref:response regulator n=1 Tax=Algoriphagus sp. AK58 TaxID=1406877 RepID=UPI00164FC814|nr:response regulator [Algoriphagus sp. AK58]MBC6365817.1 response regulator [Algoriphagus sp. AK58]